MTGLQLHAALRRKSISLPVIIVTGHADAVTCRAAFNNGVFDFVEKGFDPRELLEVIQSAIDADLSFVDALAAEPVVSRHLSVEEIAALLDPDLLGEPQIEQVTG